MKNDESRQFSQRAGLFLETVPPEPKAKLIGYTALISVYHLDAVLPDVLCAITQKHVRYQKGNWLMFPPQYAPEETLYAQLVFALKYEGVNLSILHALFKTLDPKILIEVIHQDPRSSYSRRIWFLYEWLTAAILDIADIQDIKINFVNVLDEKLQYTGPVRKSSRHRVNNNLPGVPHFCPLIRKTEQLENYIHQDLQLLAASALEKVHPDLLMRAAAFLLLQDSKASYAIEGETPLHNRAERWGQAIGQAGVHSLSEDEFLRLQQIVIADFRFVHFGYRVEGGFIGEHDRVTRYPRPVHISAKPEDLDKLMAGLIETDNLLKNADYHAVLSAAAIAFGFVFIHPFEDGNGRIHRYLIHHVLAEKGFTPEGVVFPVSYVMLEKIKQYRLMLEAYSAPRLKFIKWHATEQNNVEVLNDTIDLYRYFDATKQAEFLFSCIKETIEEILPKEIDYLKKYDEMKSFIENYIALPDRLINLLIIFLQQGEGQLSKRAREKEFLALTEQEVSIIEARFKMVFYNL